MKEFRIAHLYPDVLNLYGDRGNVRCMQQRLKWRGIESSVTEFPIGETASLSGYDVYFIGGGQDFEQTLLLADLRSGRDKELCSVIADGGTFLCVCGGFQLLGQWYETADGQRCEYLGAIDLHTNGSYERFIGNFAYRLGAECGGSTVVGFENHGGHTTLGEGVKTLGTVLVGHGNNGADGSEGVHFNNVYGTYSHGPVLPKNPAFCDKILECALGTELSPLPDESEHYARRVMLKRLNCEE